MNGNEINADELANQRKTEWMINAINLMNGTASVWMKCEWNEQAAKT